MRYLESRMGRIGFCLFLCLSYNLYFIFLLPGAHPKYLVYLDFLLAACGIFAVCADYVSFRKERLKKEEMLHDAEILRDQLKEQLEINSDMQDYIAKWCHEVKIPLAACLLMHERIEDDKLRAGMREQLERVNQQLKSALLGCKAQGSLFDIQVKKTNLSDCVRTSIRNNQFFLIKNHFQIDMEVGDLYVYTDKNWIVYVLDQLFSNAIKYKNCGVREPALKIWSSQEENTVRLFVEDNGEGISDCDLRRIFDKGYTGSNYHNGQYKSTGMGLYMAAKILGKLGHAVSVESRQGEYARFVIEFFSSNLTKL